MHSEAFSNEHLHDDVSSSEGHVGHSHGHSPDHSHEVPAFLERPMIGFIDGGQRWLLSLADRGIIDNRPILSVRPDPSESLEAPLGRQFHDYWTLEFTMHHSETRNGFFATFWQRPWLLPF
ncbi:hypothetical protein HED50_04765 [Ochrobactrum oryzae]|nr:hypothetical protein [Brucella oryzae]